MIWESLQILLNGSFHLQISLSVNPLLGPHHQSLCTHQMAND